MHLKIIKNLRGMITPSEDLGFGELDIRADIAILIENRNIKEINDQRKLVEQFPEADFIDGQNFWAIPGFVDPHTHPVFYKTREDEFEYRIKGKSYEEIAAAGGGIRNSVRAFRKASFDALTEITYQRIENFLQFGTTTIEAKSGYGLSLEDELKSLRILKKVSGLLPLTIVPTFLGAHEIPDEYQHRREKYIELIINEMIPAVAEERLAIFCDVFTEKNVFSIEESEKILMAGKEYGLVPKIHADEIFPMGGAELAAKVRAVSADHLCMVSPKGIQSMKEAEVVPVLLPGTTFFLGKKKYAPARKMIDENLPVALATDYNPGSCFTQNMPLVLSIACISMQMSPAEVLCAATLNSAKAIACQKEIGTLSPGKRADITLIDVPNVQYLPYHLGHNPVRMVVQSGNIVFQN